MKKLFLLILTFCFCIGMKGATYASYGYGCDKAKKHKNNAFDMEDIYSKLKDMDKYTLMLKGRASIIDNMDE